MRSAVIYYSRTGTTRIVANALASELGAHIVEIRCARYRPGLLRYLLAGHDSVKGKLPSIELPALDLAAYDLLLIGTPVWTSHPSLPVRAFLAGKPDLPDRVALFLTHGGHSPVDKAVAELAELLPNPLTASLAIHAKTVADNDITGRIHTFAEKLTDEPA